MAWWRWAEKLGDGADYRGEHRPPNRQDAAAGSGSPLHDLSGTYPEDIYGPDAVRLYGSGLAYDGAAVAVMQAARGRPRARVRVYRAVPKAPDRRERILDIERRKKQYLRRHRVPADAAGFASGSEYYDHLCDELDRLNALPEEETAAAPRIEPGNWVTVSRAYAKEHGDSNLKGGYRILSKTVHAGELFTDGDSLHEQGYDPF